MAPGRSTEIIWMIKNRLAPLLSGFGFRDQYSIAEQPDINLLLEFWGSGFRVQGAGFRVQGSGFRVQGSTSSARRSKIWG